jgi:hypothetical protein
MDLQPRTQVVLGEAERTDGLVRFVLEGEGFDVIGLASDDRELERVLKGARPAVIVLDGGISAAAALEARRSSPGTALVVVWPDGVSAVLAEERVDPHLVISDLGDAVRRAARRVEPIDPPIRMPEYLRIATTVRNPRVPTPSRKVSTKPARTGRRGSRILVAAGTWILVLTALATIAVAVPKAFDLSPGRRAPVLEPHGGLQRQDQRTGSDPAVEPSRSTRSATCVRQAAGTTCPRNQRRADHRRAKDRKASRGTPNTQIVRTIPGTGTGMGTHQVPVDAGTVIPGDVVPDGVIPDDVIPDDVVPGTVIPDETPGGQVEGVDVVVDSVLTGSDPATVVPDPAAEVISSSPSSAASLSAIP